MKRTLHEFLRKRGSGERSLLTQLKKRYPLLFHSSEDEIVHIALEILTPYRIEKEMAKRNVEQRKEEKKEFLPGEAMALYRKVDDMVRQCSEK